ncbi:MAG: radical SAM protein [Candidatus Eremiobacteraeota bacterium]|nr:radical SAM protein [Candidatus Eremiobacteraeota bacterium]
MIHKSTKPETNQNDIARVSAGTERVLGLSNIRMEDPPTCAYFMIGENCKGTCFFCARRSERENENIETSPNNSTSKKRGFLSRVTWKPYNIHTVLEKNAEQFENGSIRRTCFQVVRDTEAYRQTLEAVKMLKKKCDIPVCVSINGISPEQYGELYEAGVERIAFSFDAATPELYEKIKGKSWDEEWEIYLEINRRFPGRTVIHLIVGLGETEKQMVGAIETFYRHNSEVSLFAFTPIPGTPLSGRKQPSLSTYRKIQTALYMIRTGMWQCRRDVPVPINGEWKTDAGCQSSLPVSHFPFPASSMWDVPVPMKCKNELYKFENDKIIFNRDKRDFFIQNIPQTAFRTYGCPDCNRPLYNERPGQVPYNFPRELTEEERISAIELIF